MKKRPNLGMILALAVGGYYLWTRVQAARTAAVPGILPANTAAARMMDAQASSAGAVFPH